MTPPTGVTALPSPIADGATQQVLRKLELDVTRRLDGLLHGDHRGLVPGHGSEMGECRPYAPGDDVRRIDWNVTARMIEPHVRESIADRELEARVLVDLSPSVNFGTAICEKRDLAVAASAAVGFLTARAGNRFGVTVIGGDRDIDIPAKSGRPHLLASLAQLMTIRSVDGSGGTDLALAIERLASPVHRRGLAVVISDFQGLLDWIPSMRKLTVRHEVLAIEVVDPRERELPDVGHLTLVDPETGARREVNTHSSKVRAAFAEASHQRSEAIESAFHSSGVDHLELSTDRDWLLDLAGFVDTRRRRRERRAGG